MEKLKSLSPTLKKPKGMIFLIRELNILIDQSLNNLQPNTMKNAYNFNTKNNIFGDPVPDNVVKRSPMNRSPINNSRHNPLTNPLPSNIQNPYVAREYNKLQKNIFSNAAENNLINKT